ncbi:hypothetical protein [Streptomyces sp. NPDC021020]|uniref:hypothetical protein n=1 Tax=Streptomyces sp. NPDC021020 TaxID=3365109 RepID=UPI0037AA29FE
MTRTRVAMAAAAVAMAAAAVPCTTTAASAVTTVQTVKGALSAPGGMSYAQCPDGTQLIGGGYAGAGTYDSTGEVRDTVDVSAPSADRQGAWGARMHKGTVTAYALCDSDSVPTYAVRGAAASAGSTSYAGCLNSTNLIGGGYAMDPVYGADGTPHDLIEANTPSQYLQNTWAAKAHSGTATAYALCRDYAISE